MDVRSGAEEFLLVLGFAVIDDQRHCSNVNTSANGLSPQQYLYLLIPQLGDSCSLRGRAILRMYVILAHLADSRTLTMYIIYVDVVLS